jgi:DNA-binding response OmpR family regulator
MRRFLTKKRNVLLLEDDPSMVRLVKSILTRQGFRVSSFLTGRQALDAVRKEDFDALLLDLMMPHEGGITVVRELREHNPDLLRRVLLFTASPESLVATLEGDVAGVVPKPFAEEDLVRAVRAIAEQK